ncbi:MAG: DUF2095 family protein [Promethearchaeota archaeon]|jgi:hypothetical protein
MERKNKKKEAPNEIRVEDKEGLTVSYNRDEFKEKFPHLVTEIRGKKKFVKIESIENNSSLKKLRDEIAYPDELVNPGPIDFLRRCTNKDEALDILDFLLNQKEISEKEYNSFKNEILNGDGLKEFIDKHGGFKDHGYYEKKYRELARKRLKQGKS